MENRSTISLGDGLLYAFDKAHTDLDIRNRLRTNQSYFSGLYSITSLSETEVRYGICFYAGLPLKISSPYNSGRVISAVIYDSKTLLGARDETGDCIEAIFMADDLLFCTAKEPLVMSELAAANAGATLAQVGGRRYYVRVMPLIEDNGMSYAYLVAQDSLLRDAEHLKLFPLLIVVLCALMFTLFIIAILRSIFRPIQRLSKEVALLERASEPLSVPRARELEILAQTINDMIARINTSVQQELLLNQENMELQVQKNRMEMHAFRNQINPHFLFNTLECITGMARYYNIEPVTRLMMNLSACFHYSLYSPMMVPLSEEIAHLARYLEIMEERFPGKYRFIKRVEEGCEAVRVPSLLLQPLAENAITHGFRDDAKAVPHQLVLRARTDERLDALIVEMVDNGVGMDRDKLNDVLDTLQNAGYAEKHISLCNVNRRLRLLYGRDCMIVRSVSGCYTAISAVIPLHPEPLAHEVLDSSAADMHPW